MITIDEINNEKDVKIECNPPYNKTKNETFRKSSILRIRIIDVPEILDSIKIYLLNGETIELHFSAGVFVNGKQAISNEDLYNKLLSIF